MNFAFPHSYCEDRIAQIEKKTKRADDLVAE